MLGKRSEDVKQISPNEDHCEPVQYLGIVTRQFGAWSFHHAHFHLGKL
jgi:hypothetical protein